MEAVVLTTVCFLLSILPPTCIQYLTFRPILLEPQKTRVRRSYLVIFLIEMILFMAIFQFGWLEFRFLSYKKLLMSYWIPYFLAFSLLSRPYAYQNLFVAGMQGICTTTLHALAMNLVLLFVPRSAFLAYLPVHLVLYTAFYILMAPLLLAFFDRIFLKYRSLPLLAFWKYCAWLPILLSMYSGFLSLKDGPLAQDYFLPRIFHALSGIFIALIIYMGTKLIAQQVDLQRRNHLLAAQMNALSNYTSLLQDAQKRMSIFRHDSRHQLRLLSELIGQNNDKAAPTFLKNIDLELSQTQLQQWTQNQAINTAITPGLEGMKQDGVSVMADLPFPLSLPFEIALGDILAKAIAVSAQAFQVLPKDQRLLIIGTTPIHGGLLVFIKHAVSPDIPDDKNDLLQEEPYAHFVPDLNRFSRIYEATFRYDLHDHLVSLYLTIPYQT
ncbi:MAG: hypothetical protein MSS75_01650 [Megasphaera sp.]|uniref:hypothetical protein n=1 Tax=Megasphaera sp. TaxID=2023260 RepID=UPI0025C40EBD|nr:hypothetical protein [Megasphaera sp.]MCI7599750.1 hypothetical protein [Megasphaera sp.]